MILVRAISLCMLITAPTLFGSHIFFSQITGNGITISDVNGVVTAVTGPTVQFETTVSGASDTLSFDFDDPLIADFSIFTAPGIVSFSRTFTNGWSGSVTVDLVSSWPDYDHSVNGQQDTGTFYFNVASPVPEPGTMMLMAAGLGIVALRARKMRTSS